MIKFNDEKIEIEIHKEIARTYTKESSHEKTLTINSLEKIISDFQHTMKLYNPIYEIAEKNGFNLFKGDIAIISYEFAEKLGMKYDTKEIKISHYVVDDQIYFLKDGVTNIFV